MNSAFINNLKKGAVFVWEVVKVVALALAIVIPVRYFLFQPFVIEGSSMEPNFHQADYLIVDELSYRFREPQRGEVIVFKYPLDPSKRFIKRIIALPGEIVEIKGGKVFVEEESGSKIELNESSYLNLNLKSPDVAPILLEENQYFVLGDNRPYSSDSQDWGELPQANIIGKVAYRLWPFSDIQKIQTPQY